MYSKPLMSSRPYTNRELAEAMELRVKGLTWPKIGILLDRCHESLRTRVRKAEHEGMVNE